MRHFLKLKPLWAPFSDPIITTYAAAVSFHLLLSALPASVLLISFLPQLSSLFLASSPIVETPSILTSMLRYITKQTPSFTIPLSAFFTLWSASKGVLALLDGINVSMQTERLTGFFRRRIIAVSYFIFLVASVLFSLLILVFGKTLLELTLQYFFPSVHIISMIFRLRSIASIFLLGTVFSLMYRLLPSSKRPFRLCIQGGFFAASAWVMFSMAFSFYVDNFSNFSMIYGHIGILVLTALWLRICVTVLLDGAVLIRMRYKEDYHPLDILRSFFF